MVIFDIDTFMPDSSSDILFL